MGCPLLQGLLQGGGPVSAELEPGGPKKKHEFHRPKWAIYGQKKTSKISKHGEELDLFSNVFWTCWANLLTTMVVYGHLPTKNGSQIGHLPTKMVKSW